jgi:signal transduction histidine kinase
VYGERVGTLRFEHPVTPLRPADRRLLEDLAVHLGGVLHDHRLTQDLQRALERVVLAREEERRRLRRDLHDGLGPALAGHLLRLDVIGRELDRDSRAAELVRALREELRATVLDVRRVVEGLRPPALDELGLPAAVEQAVQRLTGGTGLRVDVHVAPLPALPAAAEVAAFRIVTEAVTNVVRHAQASWCRVTLETCPGVLRLVVEDDGVGIGSPRSTGNGMHTMRERAEEMRGELSVTSGEGTRVTAELPVSTVTQVVAS